MDLYDFLWLSFIFSAPKVRVDFKDDFEKMQIEQRNDPDFGMV